MKKQLLFVTILVISLLGYAQTFTHNNITYTVSGSNPTNVTVTGYNISAGTDVVIPATVTPNSSSRSSSSTTYNVTAIGYQSFFQLGITSIILPASITTIGTEAFYNNQITTIDLPAALTSIGQSAFYNNSLSGDIIIPDAITNIASQAFARNFINGVALGNNVTTIGFNAFYNNNITAVTIPDSVTTIETRAFDDNLIQSVIIGSNVSSIAVKAFANNPLNCVTSKSSTAPTIVSGGTNDTFGNRAAINLTIPNGSANDYTNANWTGFNSVTESDFGNVFTIDYITYQINTAANNEVTVTDYDTAGGTVVNVPATVQYTCTTYNVTALGYLAFNTNSITDVTLPDGLVTIGDSAFSTNNLTSITIPNTVTTIDTDAFVNNSITSVTLSDNLSHIGASAFAFNDITTLNIPDSVITIDDGAFAQNNNLTSLTLGNSVSSIGNAAFRFTALTIVTIPESVTNIGLVAFGGSNTLTDVFCQGLVPPIIGTGSGNADTFNDYRGNIHLHIPAGTMGVYVTNAGALWTGFNPVTENALSTSDFELANQVKIITNNDAITIVSPTSVTLQDYTLYNISGAIVLEGNDYKIATHTLASAVYILRLQFNQGTVIKKVIIK